MELEQQQETHTDAFDLTAHWNNVNTTTKLGNISYVTPKRWTAANNAVRDWLLIPTSKRMSLPARYTGRKSLYN
jgi:hypothetical protein